MTLTLRLSLFFLGTLAAVLLGFSATLYSLARTYLHRQIDNRLEAALDVLSATAEVQTEGVEWETHDRPVSLVPPPGEAAIAWLVQDHEGRVIDKSLASGSDELLHADSEDWRIRSRRVVAGGTNASIDDHQEGKKYPFLVLTAGLSLRPAAAALQQLLLALGVLSAGLWISAALLGRWLGRRALAPLRSMASTARTMHADDRTQRLPVAATGDELQELGVAFNGLLARLQESFERQSRFTGDASHQLRTPLAALLGQIEIALRHPRAADEYARVLRLLHSQAMQLRQIVDSLLFLARADAEAKSLPLERMDLHAWLTEHLKSWAGHARSADICLETSGAGPFEVRAQAPLLRQLLDNLLDNACKYSAAGTPITVSLSAEDDAICLTVADAGCGISQEDLPHLFEAFYRSPQVRRRGVPGLGLGLAVAQRIAAALGGTLHVRSQPEQGTIFTLQLPREREGNDEE
jgi:two-component system OmpR family sensor kinase